MALGFEQLTLVHAHEGSRMASLKERRQGLDRGYPLPVALQQADGVGADGVDVRHRPATHWDRKPRGPVPAESAAPRGKTDKPPASGLQPAVQKRRSLGPRVRLRTRRWPESPVEFDEQAPVAHE